jgi:hypothetical protein
MMVISGGRLNKIHPQPNNDLMGTRRSRSFSWHSACHGPLSAELPPVASECRPLQPFTAPQTRHRDPTLRFTRVYRTCVALSVTLDGH